MQRATTPDRARRSTRAVRVILAAGVAALISVGCTAGDPGADPPGGPAATSDTATSDGTAPDGPGDVAPEPSPGCGLAPDVEPIADQAPGDVESTFVSGELERLYRLAVPGAYDPDTPSPLVVNLHGSGSNALQASVYGNVPQAATERGWLVATPQAIGGLWELSGDGPDGVFLVELVDDLAGRYCIDLTRVHLSGMSLGAWKAAVTACANPGRFASAALVTVEVFPGTCGPLPVIAFHGTADETVPYGEGADPGVRAEGPNARLPGARTNIAAWAEHAGCDPAPEVSTIGDDVERWAYTGCDPGTGAELYTIRGGGHTWPGAEIDIAAPELTTDTIDATELALDWFEAHPRR